MPISLNDPPPPKAPQKRRSVIRRLFRGAGWLAAGPVDWMGAKRIRRSWTLIGDLFGMLRNGLEPDARFKTVSAGAFDIHSTAASYGISVQELEARLLYRRRQTGRIAYATFALAVMFFVAWMWRAVSMPLSAARLGSTLYFLPFCFLFVLIAFHNALLNFQIRVGRLANWREYILTSESFWPSCSLSQGQPAEQAGLIEVVDRGHHE